MYMKVPNRKVDDVVKDATPQEVKEAISSVNIPGLIVDMDLNYPCIGFPDPPRYADFVLVKNHLEKLGFEVS